MTEVRDSIEADVIEQIHIRSGIPKSRILLDAEVYKDLSVYGMDLWEIIDYFKKRYGTNFDEFPMLDYVPPETAFLWFWKKFGWNKNYKSLLVSHLIEVVHRGAWFDASTSKCSECDAVSSAATNLK